jgi:hypothetical protein
MVKVDFKNGCTTIIGSHQTVTKRLEQCSDSAMHTQVLSVLTYMSSANRFRDIKSKNYRITLM